MFWDASALNGYHVDASDGQIGKICDVLFDDSDWSVKWLVVDVGHWLMGCKVLLPPRVLGHPDQARRVLPANLSVQQIKDSPNLDSDLPVSRQTASRLDDFFLWSPYPAGSEVAVSNAMAVPFVLPRRISETVGEESDGNDLDRPGDPHLRSAAALTGYRLHASDGEIGHVMGLLLDDADWTIRYLAIDTKNWWPGEKVLIPPHSVEAIDWIEASITVGLARQMIKEAPRYDTAKPLNDDDRQRFLTYYGRE